MGATIIPAISAGKTSYVETLTSGTSWTVPAGVNYVNVTLFGGGGGGGGINSNATRGGTGGTGGSTTFTGATSAPGGTGGTGNNYDTGGSSFNGTTLAFTELANSSVGGQGADSANGVRGLNGSPGAVIQSYVTTTPGASITYAIGAGGTGGTSTYGLTGNVGGSGKIFIEYWV